MNIYGLHVHIGVNDKEEVIALMNESIRYLPHLLALSGSATKSSRPNGVPRNRN